MVPAEPPKLRMVSALPASSKPKLLPVLQPRRRPASVDQTKQGRTQSPTSCMRKRAVLTPCSPPEPTGSVAAIAAHTDSAARAGMFEKQLQPRKHRRRRHHNALTTGG
jgi:hypothetical protein